MELIRKEIEFLDLWYNSPLRKSPCILFGARQVGKSTLAESFAKKTNRKVIKVNFWKDTELNYPKIFTKNATAQSIIQKLEVVLNTTINPKNSILVLDEIQELPVVYSLFKTFKEDTDLPVIATGSYLKLFLSSQPEIEIPIGCTHEYLLTPLTFSDYLQNQNNKLYNVYQNLPLNEVIDPLYHESLIDTYYEYLFTGGMPEVVKVFLETKQKSGPFLAAKVAREIQRQLLSSYNNDFVVFNQKKFIVGRDIISKLALAFKTIPKELAKYRESDQSVGRFKFTSLGKNATFKRVKHIFEYLSLAGLIIKSHIVKKPVYPLMNENETGSAFKCFYFDVGILQAALQIPYQQIVKDGLSHYKGAIAENFIAQQLFATHKQDMFSWKDSNGREIEFLYQDNALIPIEVKSSKKSVPSKSLHEYIKKYAPPYAIKVAPRNVGVVDKIVSLPIYLIEKIGTLQKTNNIKE